MKILITTPEDILYKDLIEFLYEIKIVHGGTDLYNTLRRHSKIKNFLSDHQKFLLEDIEAKYFNPDGSLDQEAVDSLKKQYERARINLGES